MKKNNKKIILIIFLLTICSVLIYSYTNPQKQAISTVLEESSSISPGTNSANAILEINGVKYESEISEQTNVYDFMVKLRDEGKINFKSKTYSGMGELIEEINGLKNDKNKYWIYSVNGKEAQIGVSDYKINGGDVISWKYGND